MSRPTEVMSPFASRPPEAMALYNSVLISELLVNACWAKEQRDGTGLPWPVVYLILPLTLHPETRDSLPRDRRITLARWAVQNQDLLADMEYRVANMVPVTKRAIRHGLRVGRLGLDGTNLMALSKPKKVEPQWSDELKASVRASRFCAQWFTEIETHMAFEFLGIGD